MISPANAKNRAVVTLQDGRTARLWYVPPEHGTKRRREHGAVSQGRCVVRLPSGKFLTVRRDSVLLTEQKVSNS